MLDINLLGDRIRELRKQRGLTQNAFADELHVSFQAVSNWERGIAPLELENLINIAAYFGVLVDNLLRPQNDDLFWELMAAAQKQNLYLFLLTDTYKNAS